MRRTEYAATAAIVCAAGLSLGAQAQSAAVGKGVRPSMPFNAFCDAAPADALPVAISSPRLQWMRGLPRSRSAADILREASASPGAWIAASSRWLAVHDGNVTRRADCETGRVDSFPQARPITALAVSAFGDIAEQIEGGPTLVRARRIAGETGDDKPEFTPEVIGDGPRALAWSGRRLFVVTRSGVTIVDAAATGSTRPAAPVAFKLTPEPIAAFVYNGLTYVANGRCVNVLVGFALTPRLRRAACLRAQPPPDAVLSASRDRLTLLSRSGDVIEDLPRPTVVHAKLTGTSYDITSSLLQITEHPGIDRVPLAAAAEVDASRETDTAWADLLPNDRWNIRGGLRRMERAAEARGWINLQKQEDGWSAGNGVAAIWQRQSSFVTSEGRGLRELARLTDQNEFDEKQIRNIISGNSELAETLEGAFIENGWVPVGAFIGGDTTAPPALVAPDAFVKQLIATRPGASALGGALLPTGQCRVDGGTRVDRAMSGYVRKGIPAAGTTEGRAAYRTMLKAEDVAVRVCEDGTTRIEVAELKSVAAGNPAAQAPPRVQPAAVAAVRGLPPGVTNALVTSWLDRVLRSTPGLRLLLPTTSLEVMFVTPANKSLEALQLKGVRLTSAEAVPASLRAQDPNACSETANANQKRLRDEQLIKVHGLPFDQRALAFPMKIAVVENAVPLLSPVFVRDDLSVWVEPKQLGGFEPVQPPLAVDPTARAARFLKHGTQVSGIIFASPEVPVRGVLSDVPLVWIDAAGSARDSVPTFDKLAGRKAIVNVSARLDSTWSSLNDNNKDWAPKLLFVAAARDPVDTDGPPLTWTSRANVLGVGVVDHDGNPISDFPYDREVIDLVAPGAEVPTFENDTTVGCDKGTSFAAPYVSAIAAMLADRMPGWTATQLKARLLSTADWKSAYSGKVKGGLVNAARAIENLDKNVLVIKRGTNTPLKLDVTWKDGAAFEISGVERPGGGRKPHRIQWADVLRWELVAEPDGTQSTRVAFLDAGRYVVLEKVAFAADLTLSLDKCTTRESTPQPVSCSGTRAELILEYTSKRPDAVVIEFP